MSFNSFINSFTNSPIQPSDVRYLPVVFSGASTNIQLEWVFQNPATLYPFCQVINITGTGTNTYSITMPNALYASTTQSTIVFNQSAANVTVYAYGYPSTSVTICVCEPGLAYYLGTTDNSTSAGTWLPPITLGAGSSSVTAASLIDTSSVLPAEPSAGGLQAYSTHLKINQAVFVYTGTAYIGNLNDLGNVVSYTAPGSGTYQLMAANTVPNGFITGLQNRSSGSGQVTINVTGSDLLNGASTPFNMLVNESTYLISDGLSNWFTFCYSANALYAINNITYNIPGSFTSGTTIAVTATQAAYQIQTFQTTSGSTPTVTVVYPGIIAQQWFINNLSTSNLLVYLSPDEFNLTYQYTIGPGGTQTMFTDGLHLYISPNFISDEDIYLPDGSVTDPSLTFVNDIHTGLYRNTSSSALVITQGSTNVATFLNTSLTSTVPIYIPSGVVTVPSLAFSAQTTTGLYYTTNALNIAIEGVQTTNFNSGFLESLVPISAPVGSVGAPSFTFNGNTTTGFYYTANQLNVSVGGSSPLFFTTAGTTALSPIYALAGSDASPSYAFDGSGTSTGLYFVASPTITLNITVSMTPVMSFTDTNITALFPVDAPAYTQDTISIYSLMRAYG